jgi:hypothetical protein
MLPLDAVIEPEMLTPKAWAPSAIDAPTIASISAYSAELAPLPSSLSRAICFGIVLLQRQARKCGAGRTCWLRPVV